MNIVIRNSILTKRAVMIFWKTSMDDVAQYLDLTVPEIISAFLRNKNNVDFSVWFQEKIDEAITYAENDLIFEFDEEDDE